MIHQISAVPSSIDTTSPSLCSDKDAPLRIAYVHPRNTSNPNEWSGLACNIRESIRGQGCDVSVIDGFESAPPLLVRLLGRWHRHVRNAYFSHAMHPATLQMQAGIVQKSLEKLPRQDWVVSPGTWGLAGLRKQYRTATWHDSTIRQCFDFYRERDNLARISKEHWIKADRAALHACSLVCYSSRWAADDAIEQYGISASRVHVIPFGANSDSPPDHESEALEMIQRRRANNRCTLLFVGKDWERKGGKLVLEILNELRSQAKPVELIVAGCSPFETSLPDGVKCLGFLDKSKISDRLKLKKAFEDADFFVMPSHAECFGLVYAEASSYAVPSLGCDVGGVGDAIKQGVNGWLLPLTAGASMYAEKIWRAFSDRKEYEMMALSSYRHYRNVLNWNSAGRRFVELMREALNRPSDA